MKDKKIQNTKIEENQVPLFYRIFCSVVAVAFIFFILRWIWFICTWKVYETVSLE